MLHFIDFEVFKTLWTCVIIEPSTRSVTTIVNDKEKLQEYYDTHKNEIYVGYNIRGYDQYIFKGILCDLSPYEISRWIVNDKKPGYQFSNLFRSVSLIFYDVMNKFRSLKELEGFMGNDIRETTIPFDYEGEFTKEMIDEVIYYNKHDVEQTIEVFLQTKNDFDAHLDLLKTFCLPLSYLSKTQAQLTASALECRRQEHSDEWNISFIPTIKIDKYKYIWDWFKNPENYMGDKLDTEVCAVPHTFGLGGLHGAPLTPVHAKGLIIHIDVTSFYPSIMIKYDLLSRNVKDKSIYKDIYDKRLALKKAGKKTEQAPYKIILNSTFGITNDKYSLAYDPRRNHEVTINGQLLLLDLLEKLEGHCELLQSNTDGIIIQIPDTDEAFNKIDDICWEWECRTGMSLGFDYIKEIYQKDVNNYLFIQEDNSIECKGAYVKESESLDNDLSIVNEALREYMINHTSVEATINNCNELIKFQKIVKVSSKYLRAWHNNAWLTDKTFRVFASTDSNDTYIGRQKEEGATIEKFANTPESCFIDNSDINNKKLPQKLNKKWYIDLAKKRLDEFGVE